MKKEMRFEVRLTARELWQFSMYHANAGAAGLFNLIFTVLQPMLLYGKVRRQAKTPAMTKPMYLTFKEEGLLVEQSEQEALFAWDQMGRMDRKPAMVVLYMDRVHAYLLPNKVLGDQKEEFFEMVKAHLPRERRKGF